MKITVVTATGDRPDAFTLCQKWIREQTRFPDQWVIVDDGMVSLKPPSFPSCDYFRREPQKDDPKHTMIINLKEAFKHISGNVVLIIEDDEYYSPKYIEIMAEYLERYEVVGVGRSKYFHLPSGNYVRHMNLGHASLAQTGFRTSFLPKFMSVLDGDNFLDIRIWTILNGEKAQYCDAPDLTEIFRVSKDGRGLIFDDGEADCLYLGIKGLPGRPGIGGGHAYRGKITDEQKALLKRLIPQAYMHYLKFVE